MEGTVLSNIIAYEEGKLDHEETVSLFQNLVNSGLAWKLQGSYGRTAQSLIDGGEVTIPSPDGVAE